MLYEVITYDLFYIQNRRPSMDIKILLKIRWSRSGSLKNSFTVLISIKNWIIKHFRHMISV